LSYALEDECSLRARRPVLFGGLLLSALCCSARADYALELARNSLP
jgi:hypothetical protein